MNNKIIKRVPTGNDSPLELIRDGPYFMRNPRKCFFYSLPMKGIIMGTRPLLYAPLAYHFFLLSVAQSVSSCCRPLKVVTMSRLRKITSFLFLFCANRGTPYVFLRSITSFLQVISFVYMYSLSAVKLKVSDCSIRDTFSMNRRPV